MASSRRTHSGGRIHTRSVTPQHVCTHCYDRTWSKASRRGSGPAACHHRRNVFVFGFDQGNRQVFIIENRVPLCFPLLRVANLPRTIMRPAVNETSRRICSASSQPAIITAGVMNFAQMSDSLSDFLFMGICYSDSRCWIHMPALARFPRQPARSCPLWSTPSTQATAGTVDNQASDGLLASFQRCP